MDKWEYTAIDSLVSAYGDVGTQVQEMLTNMNAMGDEGWELTTDAVIYGKGSNGMQFPVLLFKRRVEIS